jgi:hypothetical protein
MNDEIQRILNEAVVAYLRYYPIILLERIKKKKKNLGQPTCKPRIELRTSQLRILYKGV